ncbi:MAG: NUDIX hydrolase [Methanomicrobiales archaeon]|jgi:ADP-ribose pyrophosphatase|nr:NUDIX hydrolase [Methanomicrobiales archaeon]
MTQKTPEVLYDNSRFRIEKKEYRIPNGTTKKGIIISPRDAVAIMPVSGDHCFLLKQYRFPIDQYIYEVPAGAIEEGETPDEAAYRELIEETGLCAQQLIPYGFIYPAPGYSTERLWLYEAVDLTPSNQYQMDEDEVIEVVKLDICEMLAMIREGDIVDAKTMALAMLCFGGR